MATLPYGLREVRIALLSAAGVPGTFVKLPNGQTLSFSEKEDFQELRGDDKVIAKRGNGPIVEWDLEAGGIDLAAYAIMNGGVVTTTGAAGTLKNVYAKTGTDAKPSFWAEGQAMSESGGDFHVTLYKCKADGGIQGELKDGEFWVTKASGTGIANAANKLYDFTENATAAAIIQPT